MSSPDLSMRSAAPTALPMTPLTTLTTPTALLDERKMMANIARMQLRMNALGVRFRPHVKTSKCVTIVERQLAAGAQGITVSTLKEAEQFFKAGITDILYAVCIPPTKLDQALALRAQGCALKLLVDSVDAAQAVVAKARVAQHRFDVMIEIDCDGHRSGVQPEDATLIDIGRVLHDGACNVVGVMTHAGASYDFNTPDALAAMAEQERSRTVRASERLRAAGVPCPVVSVGSTPTALSARHLDGVTEVRAGVYVTFDLVMANIGVCTPDDVALSILTTVIGHQAAKGWAIVDAGWMAMSRDRGTQEQRVDYGYGAVCDAKGAVLAPYVVTGANQEHGIVSRADGVIDGDIAKHFPVGTRLRILPNHSCATGAQFEAYHALLADGGIATWPRFGGW